MLAIIAALRPRETGSQSFGFKKGFILDEMSSWIKIVSILVAQSP